MLGRGKPAAAAFLAAGLVLAAGAAGCSRQSDTSRASVESCVQFGIAAIKHHVTVTWLPPACQGLTGAQIDSAVGSALHSAAIGAQGKVRQRERIAKASHYLEHLIVSVPAQRGKPQVLVPAAHQISRTTLGLIALFTWLITVSLGLWMMIRWILRGRARHTPAGRLRRPPALDLAHLGLASASLLVWIAYLATGLVGLAWTASALLPLVAGLGMTLVFLRPSMGPADSAAAQVPRAVTAPDPARGDSSRGRRPPVVTVGAHIIFATATILFALLTAIGVS
jgi:hypothetical protein